MLHDPLGYYAHLGIQVDASASEIRRAYRVRAMALHPDRNPGDPNATIQFQNLQQAYRVLASAEERRRYDEGSSDDYQSEVDPESPLPFFEESVGIFRLRASKGLTKFGAEALLRANNEGLHVERLGLIAWSDIVRLEGIPDSWDFLIVHTESWGDLLVQASVRRLAPVLSFFIALDEEMAQASAVDPSVAFRFKALPFNWRIFKALMSLGYLIGFMVIFYTFDPAKGLQGIIFPIVIGGCAAYMIWAFPLWRLNLLIQNRMRIFENHANQLRSINGKWSFDLGEACVQRHKRSGLFYDLDFISIRPRRGPAVDLLVQPRYTPALYDRLFGRSER